MASVAFQLIEEVTAHAQSDSLEDAREICADGTYFPNNLSNLSTSTTCFGQCCCGYHQVGYNFSEKQYRYDTTQNNC